MFVMEHDLLLAVLERHNVNIRACAVADIRYSVPRPSWVLNTMAPAWMHFAASLRGDHYITEAHDCDDFTRLCACYAHLCHARTVGSAKGVQDTGLLFGEFWFFLDSYHSGHAVNVFIDEMSQLRFFEPQTGREMLLTQKEIRSCFLCRF